MAERIPTQVGDVLILETDKSFAVHAVGLVTKDGQQDFDTQVNVKYESDAVAAMAYAKVLRAQGGGRIFIRDIDTGKWSEISL
jgi:hypothetical protein